MKKCYSTDEEREKVIVDNIKLIYHYFNKMNMSFRLDDMYDIGLIGLIKGVDSFDVEKGYKLSTYLISCIKNEIRKHLAYESTKGRTAEVLSLEKPMMCDNEEYTLENLVGYDAGIEEQVIKEEILNMIDHSLCYLSERNERVIKHLYGLDGFKEMSTVEVAKKFNVSPQRIRDIKNRAINLLKYHLRKYN